MKFVSEILKLKGTEVFSVGPDDTVYGALELMADKNIGAVLVLEDGQVRGILSERDYARKIVLKGRVSRQTPVREIATEVVFTVEPSDTVEHCMQLMTDKRIRHLPVMQDGELGGLISIGDVVKAVISRQKFKIEQLENYIRGDYPSSPTL